MSYQVGDVVNGHRLGPDNQWHPVEPGQANGGQAPPPPAAPGATASPQQPAKGKKPLWKRWWFIALALLVLILIIRSATSGGGSPAPNAAPAAPAPSASAPAAPAPVPPAAPAAGLNTPVRDGDFEFTVTSVRCGQASIGGQYSQKAAQGQFCTVNVNVRNTGSDAQTFDASAQKAIDATGNKLSADTAAGIYVTEAQWFTPINPGNTARGVVVFDIPKGGKITALELHDSAFSGGTRVAVP